MSKKNLKRNITPDGPLSREEVRYWMHTPISDNDKALAEGVIGDVLDAMRHLPSEDLTFAVCWERFVEEMAAVSPPWEVCIGKPRQ